MPSISSKYIKGLNNDLGISKLSNDTLTDALNINITTDLGYSSYVIENLKGTSLSFSIPDLRSKIRIQVTGVVQGIFEVQSNFPTGPTTFVNITLADNITTVQELYDFLTNNLSLQQLIPSELQVFVSQETLVIQQFTAQILNIQAIGGITWSNWVPVQNDLSIIGWGQLGENLILATCPYSQTDSDPLGNNQDYYGQIWNVSFRPDSDEVLNALYPNLSGGAVLNPQYHLAYNGKLNFSRFNEIYREMECRAESPETGNVYFVDDYNYPKVINVFNPNAQTIEEGLLDWLPDASLSVPILQQITDGGSLPISKIQITYQYANFDGASSNYAPFSNLVDLTDSFLSAQFQDYQGAESTSDVNSGKAVRFKIDLLDRRYDFIRVVLVIYELQNLPMIYRILEIPITGDDITFTVTGSEPKEPLTLDEVITSQLPFERVKTMTQKKNRLYVGNVATTKRKLNFDARAYRFDSNGECIVYSQNGDYKKIDSSNWKITEVNGVPVPAIDIADSEDVVNPYNDESGTIYGLLPSAGALPDEYDFWLNNHQYKHQSDGTTIGGEGPFVSYTFGSYQYQGSNAYVAGQTNYVGETAPYITVDANLDPPVIQAPGTLQEYPVQSSFNSIKSPYQSVIMKTLARGEVYRVGITGLSEKGEETFVEWIGDIKVPEPRESIVDEYFLSQVTDPIVDLKYLTLNLTIDTTTFFSQNPDIVSFKVVFVERKESDKTRFSMGAVLAPAAERLWNPPTSFSFESAGLLAEGNSNANSSAPVFTLGIHWNKMSGSDSNLIHYNFGFRRDSANVVEFGRLPIYKSPDIDFLPISINNGYYKEIQWYKAIDDIGRGDAPSLYDGFYKGQGRKYWNFLTGSSNPNWTSQGIYFRYFDAELPLIPGRQQVHQINNQALLNIEGFVPPSFSTYLLGNSYVHFTKWLNGVGGNEDPSVAGIGTKSLFAEVQNPFNELGNDPFYQRLVAGNFTVDMPYKRIVSYCKYNFGQYGGPWRANRYVNFYKTQSTTILKKDCLPLQALIVPGDTFMVNYDCVLSAMHWSTDDAVASSGSAENRGLAPQWRKSDTMLQTSLIFPTESSVNTELRVGKHWAKDQNDTTDGPEFANFLFDEFFYNPVYQQENNIKLYISAPFDLERLQLEQPHTVYVSKRKFDNEAVDSWRIFPVNDFMNLEGTYGEINKIVNFTERLISLQERAVAQIASEELGTVQDQTGAVIKTGTGAILARYDYLTKDSGTLHQHSVTVSPFGILYFDARLKKVMKLGAEGNASISDVKGLSSFFRENLKGDILSHDNILLGLGVHGVFDTVYNRHYLTFEDKYYPIESYTPNGQPRYAREPEIKTFTISYNENIQAFESFYSFQPQLFISLGRRLYSALPDLNNQVYTHNTGAYGIFYNQRYPSYIEFIVNADPQSKLTFKTDYLQYWSQSFNSQNIDQPLDTLTSLVLSNDYQNSLNSLQPLGSYAKRFERSWRVSWLRDYSGNQGRNRLFPYLRDKYLRIRAEYDNTSGNWFRLHDFSTFVSPSFPYEQ